MSELKSCNHCRSENVSLTETLYNNCVMCANCGSTSPDVELWNTRQSDWISVDERLPEDMMRMILAWDHRINQPRLLLGVHLKCEGIRHWQPLPEPPKEV